MKKTNSILVLSFLIVVAGPTELIAQKKPVDPEPFGGSKEFKRTFEQEVNYPESAINKGHRRKDDHSG